MLVCANRLRDIFETRVLLFEVRAQLASTAAVLEKARFSLKGHCRVGESRHSLRHPPVAFQSFSLINILNAFMYNGPPFTHSGGCSVVIGHKKPCTTQVREQATNQRSLLPFHPPGIQLCARCRGRAESGKWKEDTVAHSVDEGQVQQAVAWLAHGTAKPTLVAVQDSCYTGSSKVCIYFLEKRKSKKRKDDLYNRLLLPHPPK